MGKEFDNTRCIEIPRSEYVPPSRPDGSRTVFVDYPKEGRQTVIIYHPDIRTDEIISKAEEIISANQ